MLSKLIKKNQPVAEAPPEAPAGIAWEDRFKAAQGNDSGLLALALEAPSIDRKLACVQALASEEALKTAEREFRKRDRRVHSLAKQRYETLIRQRETRASAAELIKAAFALVEAPTIPANRLADLKQAWELLPHEFIEDASKAQFAGLQAELAELMRERGERSRAANRWLVSANEALEKLRLARAGVIAGGTGLQELAGMFAAAGERAQAVLAEAPVPCNGAVSALTAEIRSALEDSAPIEARLALLGELSASQMLQENEGSGATAAAAGRWKELPAISDQRIEKALNERFEDYLSNRDAARRKQQKQSSEIAREKDKAARLADEKTLKAAVDATEAALAAGHLAAAAKQLAILQAASGKGAAGAGLQARIDALQAEFSRLKGWQHWGGGRARDDLVAEAEALASTVAPESSRPAKMPVKQLADGIEQLRARWKELDRLGGATSKGLWERFDAALKAAYVPVAAHLAKLKEARQENLVARKALLDALEAVDVSIGGEKAPDWKAVQRALLHFETEWRKLGPVEHTVPHKAQGGLLERMKAGVARLEEPLKQMQTGARAEREQIIARARALGGEANGRDTMAKLRELQSQWQSHARSMPLPRKLENSLWDEFKAATDALMSQRQAAMSARDAELRANQAAREALIAQIGELSQDTSPADIRRVLAGVDAEWRKAGEAPRSEAGKLESRYRAARERANEYIAGSVHRAWQRTCDTLLAKLALCEEVESATPPADGEARWKELPLLPAAWERALQARYKSGESLSVRGEPASPNSGEALNRLLLQLEASLEIPSPAAFQAARQTLKLLAMKEAMEGRKSATPAWPEIEKMSAEAIGYSHLGEDQRSRLQAIVAALRRSARVGS